MRFTVKKKFLVAKIDEKTKVNLYTLLDTDNFDKFIAVGTKETDVVEKDTAEVEISVSLTNERFVLSNGETRFLDVGNKFVSSIQKVKK